MNNIYEQIKQKDEERDEINNQINELEKRKRKIKEEKYNIFKDYISDEINEMIKGSDIVSLERPTTSQFAIKGKPIYNNKIPSFEITLFSNLDNYTLSIDAENYDIRNNEDSNKVYKTFKGNSEINEALQYLKKEVEKRIIYRSERIKTLKNDIDNLFKDLLI